MLEIILLIYLCKSIGAIVRSKGRKPLVFQILLVMLWIGGEFFGGVVAGVVHAVRHGDVPFEFGISMYLYALSPRATLQEASPLCWRAPRCSFWETLF